MTDSFKAFTEYGVLGAIIIVLLLFIWAQYKDSRKQQDILLEQLAKWRNVLESNTKVVDSAVVSMDRVRESLKDVEIVVRHVANDRSEP